MKKGDVIRAVTPAKGPIFGGYWHAIYVENTAIARHLPRDGSFSNGTDIKAVGEGKTKAYYLNSVYIPSPDTAVRSTYTNDADWFWIEVRGSNESD